MIQTGGFAQLRATSGDAITSAPPPSLTMQHSSRCSGSASVRDSTTSLIDTSATGSKSKSVMPFTASGLRIACARVATEISANCSLVVPYSYMWRIFTSA